MVNKLIRFFLDNRLVTYILLIILIGWGIATAPFAWDTDWFPRTPIPVDAIPDIGENQQIVATEWMGRSPKDIQDQITYPLTTALLGIPGVKTIRSTSMFGMSFIYIIFSDDVEFYWSRSRILEKLNSLPAGTIPKEAKPSLGPDATALGQIFWYTLEGRNPKTGKSTGGWDPDELRTLQDFYVKYSLSSAEGVSEVASIGGYVNEYQIDIDPEAMKAYGVNIMDVMKAVQNSNLDIGAETIELNQVEYVIRGLGYIKSLEDIEQAVVSVKDNIPVTIKQVAKVHFGPATRRGGLDKNGMEAVGAVVVARYKSNPMEVINNIKRKISEIEPGLPSKTLPDGTVSKVTIVPFYDRSGLIHETIGTLESALMHEILICIIVVIVLLMNFRSSMVVALLLPIGVLMTFIMMYNFGIDANIVALSGIAIAIGVMTDVGIVDVENIIRNMEMPGNEKLRGKQLLQLIFNATTQVRMAVIIGIGTTIISFLPVFAMEAAEGKLFKPLAFTKTFAILSSLILGFIALPTLSYLIFSIRSEVKRIKLVWNLILMATGVVIPLVWGIWPAIVLLCMGINNICEYKWSEKYKNYPKLLTMAMVVLFALYYLISEWMPLGAQNHFVRNFLFVTVLIAIILVVLSLMVRFYEPVLRWCLENKVKFLLIPVFTTSFGILVWLGFNNAFGFIAKVVEKTGWSIRKTSAWQSMSSTFPGIGSEFMPALNEGSYLLMPTSMPHAGVEKNIEYVKLLDKKLATIPEVELTVGKWGRVNSALDPANIQMFENLINYKPEFILDRAGHRKRFKTEDSGVYKLKDGTTYDPEKEGFRRMDTSLLIADEDGEYFRQWRPEIRKPDDIWNEIVKVTQLPGLTSAPKLQPIETRLVMLSTGMRSPMGIKVYGPDLETIENTGIEIGKQLANVPSVEAGSVFAERGVGSPYLLINIDRWAIARYGMSVRDVQEVIQTAVGGMELTKTVEGRERFPVRVRYAREMRTTPDDLKRILVPSMDGTHIPLGELANIEYESGPQMIRSENTFLTGYVTFDKKPEFSEVDVVHEAQEYLKSKIESGELLIPKGVTYHFSGNYEQQQRAVKRLAIVIPISLLLIFFLLYYQFKTVTASLIHFSGVLVAFGGGFILLWLYGQGWFMNFSVSGVNMRDLFQMGIINLSVAVWVGFISLFGLATNDGVIMGTYIHQVFEERKPTTVHDVREAVVDAGKKRVRPAMMTAAVVIIALLPVLTSTGKGADVMLPIAIPTFGGMVIQLMTIYVVPVFQAIWREREVKKLRKEIEQ